jgi:hypothetical protein
MTNPDDRSSICIGCGLCCDGTLHGHTDLREEDKIAAAAVGLTVVEREGKPIFWQPCARFSCGTCSVYQARPPVCRQYRCALLKKVEEGRVTPEEARNRIAMAMKLRLAVIGLAPEANTPQARSELARTLKGELPSLGGEKRLRAAKLLLDLVALDEFLGKWFRKKEILDPATDGEASQMRP